jgi:hypothetical protein
VFTLTILAAIAALVPILRNQLTRLLVQKCYDSCSRSDATAADPLTQSRWRELNKGIGINMNSMGTIFLGSLRTPDAQHEYLVGVDIISLVGTPNGFSGVTQARTLTRQSRLNWPICIKASNYTIDLNEKSVTTPITPTTAKVDAADPSHFTIVMGDDNRSAAIDGWLRDDGTVVLELAERATTAPAPPSPATSRSSDRSPGPAAGRVGR